MYVHSWVYMFCYSPYFSLESYGIRTITLCVSIRKVTKAKDFWNVGKGKRVLSPNESVNSSTTYPNITHSHYISKYYGGLLVLICLIHLFFFFFAFFFMTQRDGKDKKQCLRQLMPRKTKRIQAKPKKVTT